VINLKLNSSVNNRIASSGNACSVGISGGKQQIKKVHLSDEK